MLEWKFLTISNRFELDCLKLLHYVKDTEDKISHFAITTSMCLLLWRHQLVQFSILKTGKFGWMNARATFGTDRKKFFFFRKIRKVPLWLLNRSIGGNTTSKPQWSFRVRHARSWVYRNTCQLFFSSLKKLFQYKNVLQI